MAEHTFTFTDEQHTTLIAALGLAAQQYAHPGIVIDTLAVISPRAAEALTLVLSERENEAETSLRPRPGETAEQTLEERVTRAIKDGT